MRSLEVCGSLGAEAHGVLFQRDTYFQTRQGRLKLREEAGAAPHLISYTRPDRVEQRESHYRIVEVGRPEELKAALGGTLGIQVVVTKERRLFLWEGVRIHLDQVEGLGPYIEFEAVVALDSDLWRERKQVQLLRSAFGIADADLVAGSYCDLVSCGSVASKNSIGPERFAIDNANPAAPSQASISD